MIKEKMTIFYVRDQEVATQFYQSVLDVNPALHVPGMTKFDLGNGSSLGLMPLTGIKKLLGDQYFQRQADRSPKAELYLCVDDAESYLDRASQNGAQLILPLEARDWGDRVGYCLDPDGYILAFAETK